MSWRAVFFGLVATAIVAALGWALLGSRLLVVRSVQVTGTGPLVSRAEVLRAAQIPRGLPLIRVNAAVVAHRVEQIQQVQSATVARDWPGTVVITVRPRTPVFAVAGAGDYALVDAFGVDVRLSARRPPSLPLLTVGGPGAPLTGTLRGNQAVRAAAQVLAELPRSIAHRVRAVAAVNASDVSVRLTGGVVVVWGSPGRAAQKARELAVLMRTHARYYDVSAPGTAVTRG
ncbi:MAG TPA: FtsQ-type POTRA domain-containing protein [Streptosporangiaceae bacterium]